MRPMLSSPADPPHIPRCPPSPRKTTGQSINGDDKNPPPTATGPSPPNKQQNPGTPPQHVRWIKPRGPQDIPVTMSNHVQLIPTAVLIAHSKGLLCDQLPEEISTGMVRTRYHRR